MRVGQLPVVAVIVAFGVVVGASRPVHADSGWLDAAVSENGNWNASGMTLPSTTTASTDPTSACAVMVRPAETLADQAVTAAGWTLVGQYRSGWGIATVDATAGFDGMCRSSARLEFVFVDGVFAGTTSPVPMHDGGDGAGGVLSINGGNQFGTTFERFRSSDPHCCPSGHADVRYRVDRTDAGPILVPVQATTFWNP